MRQLLATGRGAEEMEHGLPAEMWLHVFGMLTPQELASSCLPVCKAFNRLGNDQALWHHFFTEKFGPRAKPRHQRHTLRQPELNWKREYIWRSDPFNRVDFFNEKPAQCIESMRRDGIVTCDEDVIRFLRTTPGLQKSCIQELIMNPIAYGFDQSLFEMFIESFDFKKMGLLDALRVFVSYFGLPRAERGIKSSLAAFAAHCERTWQGAIYMTTNDIESISDPKQLEMYICSQLDEDQIYVMAYSIIMLNADAHHPSIKEKMPPSQYIDAMRAICPNVHLPERMLLGIYRDVHKTELTENYNPEPRQATHGHSSTSFPRQRQARSPERVRPSSPPPRRPLSPLASRAQQSTAAAAAAREESSGGSQESRDTNTRLRLAGQVLVRSGPLKLKCWFGAKKRFFILSSNYLLCYRSEPEHFEGTEPLGYIALTSTTTVTVSPKTGIPPIGDLVRHALHEEEAREQLETKQEEEEEEADSPLPIISERQGGQGVRLTKKQFAVHGKGTSYVFAAEDVASAVRWVESLFHVIQQIRCTSDLSWYVFLEEEARRSLAEPATVEAAEAEAEAA